MDLDDEELEATRRLNGVAKKSNIERTDINVGSIEKDIKRCEQLIKEVENDLTTVYLKGYADAEEKYKSRIKKLEAKLEFKKWGDLDNIQFDEYMSQFIPKQKVKNKIEEAKHNKKVGNTAYEYTEEDVWDTVKDELEKLLEGE